MDADALRARLAWAERELEAIYAIDALRDEARSPEGFLQGCAALLRRIIDADLIQIITLDVDDCPAQHIVHERWQPEDRVPLMAATAAALTEGRSAVIDLDGGQAVVGALSVRGERLGSLVLGKREGAWSAGERRIIDAITSQIDSAIAGLRLLHQLDCRKRELEAIYRLDRLIDANVDFDVAIAEALALLAETIAAPMSFIMLYGPDGQELELRAATGSALGVGGSVEQQQLWELARETIEAGKLVRRGDVSATIGAYMGLPLILQNQVIGVFGGCKAPGQGGFNSDQVRMLQAIASQMDTALFEDRQQRRIRETFARYVSPAVVDLMLKRQDQEFLAVHRQALTILFSDMRGFTRVSEQLEAGIVAQMLNEHLAAMTEVIREAEGTVDKFVGDEVVAFFGAPLARDDHALQAVLTAQAMQRRHQALMAEWVVRGLPAVPIGIGIGTGEVIVGNIGSPQMMNYTAIGPDVNLAARLCGAAEAGQILINAATYALVAGEIVAEPIEPLQLRHIANAVQAYSVVIDQ